MWVIRTDSSGNLLHQKCLGGFNGESAFAMKQTQDGNFLVAGYTLSIDGDITENNGYRDLWIIKADTLSNITWQKCLGGTGSDYGFSTRCYILGVASYHFPLRVSFSLSQH